MRDPKRTRTHQARGELSRRQLLVLGGQGAALALFSPTRVVLAAGASQPGTVSGVIRYAGQAGKPPRLKLSGDTAYCKKHDLRSEALLQGPGGGLRNVVVHVAQVTWPTEIPADIPTLAERRCTFDPHVMTLTKGQKLRLLNDDPVLNTFHAVHLSTRRTLFNIGMPKQGQQAARRVRTSGVIKMLCDVHPWELGYVLAFDHPHHAVTDQAGRFTLPGLPPGRHWLGLWHETLGTAQLEVTVRPGVTAEVEHVYPAAE